MELYIENPQNLELEAFAQTILIPRIRLYIQSHLNVALLRAIEDYLNSPKLLNQLLINPQEPTLINAVNIVLAAANNLVINHFDNDIIIRIDSEKTVPRLTAKLIELASLVNYGSLGCPAFPIFDQAFDEVAQQFPQLYKEFTANVS